SPQQNVYQLVPPLVHDFHRHFIDDRFMAAASMTAVGIIYGARFGMLVEEIGLSVVSV
ncbi:hypothetical protein A2U01_0036933, partial [Trifolium medium]|nr:hypothetical protein [Trifolium medium]